MMQTLYKIHFSFIFGFHLLSFAIHMTSELRDVPAGSFITHFVSPGGADESEVIPSERLSVL
jgi:hypothetical protein